jgi:hypothetical protein
MRTYGKIVKQATPFRRSGIRAVQMDGMSIGTNLGQEWREGWENKLSASILILNSNDTITLKSKGILELAVNTLEEAKQLTTERLYKYLCSDH